MNCARFFILSACFLCSVLLPCSASAEQNYTQELIDIYNQLNHMELVIGDMRYSMDYWYPIIAGVSNAPSGGDLNNNPWWATNSAFGVSWGAYANVFPDDGKDVRSSFSFPQFMSLWSARLQTQAADPNYILRDGWFSQFGVDEIRRNFSSLDLPDRIRRGYTWFDWVSDFMRSNMIANSAINTNELGQWAALSGADYVEEFKGSTNAVAIGRNITNSLDDVMDTFDDTLSTRAENEASSLFNSFDFDDWFDFQTTARDPTLMIFPESTIGGVHVGAVVGSIALPYSVSNWVSLVAAWLYRLILFVMLFSLVKGEYTYWTSLGHVEGAS